MKKIVAILLAVLMVLAMSAVAEERLYIPVMAKGFQHQFWQTVAAGAQKAAEDYDVDIYFDGPASETNIDEQVEMLGQRFRPIRPRRGASGRGRLSRFPRKWFTSGKGMRTP